MLDFLHEAVLTGLLKFTSTVVEPYFSCLECLGVVVGSVDD